MMIDTTQYSEKSHYRLKADGFTLIELMVTVAIMAILMAIAIPSYQKYIVRNAENVAKEKMLLLSGSLERWRAKNLSYKSYVPSGDFIAGQGYTTHAGWGNTGICIPSTARCDYKIRLFTTAGSAKVGLGAANADITKWQAIAIPIRNNLSNAKKFYLDSSGKKCFAIRTDSNYSSFTGCIAANTKW